MPAMHALRFWLTAIVALFGTGATTRADSHYVIVLGAQATPQRPQFSHSWAVFIRVADPNCGPAECFTISWLPQTEIIRPMAVAPEPGRNFGLEDTFRIVLGQCEHVSAWGPYEIDPELYCLAAEHKRRLESGAVRYIMFDAVHNPNHASNCIHALTVFVPARRRLRVGRVDFGEIASYEVTHNYRALIQCTNRVHPCVADLVGLDRWPIRWRTLEEGRPFPRLERLRFDQ